MILSVIVLVVIMTMYVLMAVVVLMVMVMFVLVGIISFVVMTFTVVTVPVPVLVVVAVGIVPMPVGVAVDMDGVGVVVMGMDVPVPVPVGPVARKRPRYPELIAFTDNQPEQVRVPGDFFPGTIADLPNGQGRKVDKLLSQHGNERCARRSHQFALKACPVYRDIPEKLQGGGRWRGYYAVHALDKALPHRQRRSIYLIDPQEA